MARTAYFILADGMRHRAAIHRRIKSRDLKVVNRGIVEMPREMFEQLYPRKEYRGFTPGFWKEWEKRAVDQKIEVGIIEGRDAVRRFASLAGRATDPLKNPPGTIRRDFGKRCVKKIDGICMHNKVIHRPLDNEEAARNISIAEKLLGI